MCVFFPTPLFGMRQCIVSLYKFNSLHSFSYEISFSWLILIILLYWLYCLSVRTQDLMWEIELDGKVFPHPPYLQFQSLLHPRYVSHPKSFGYLKWIVSPINIYVPGFESHTKPGKLCLPNLGQTYVPIKSQVLTTQFFSLEIFSDMKILGKI